MREHEIIRKAMIEMFDIDINNPDDSNEPGYSLPKDAQFDDLLKKELFKRWKNVSKQEQEILVYRFGLSNGVLHTEAETSELYRISPKEVRQAEFKVFGRRQRSLNAEKLREYISELRKKRRKNSWKYQIFR